MARPMTKIFATAAAVGLSLAMSFGASTTGEAFGRGAGGGHFGGGHFGGGHFGGGHFGGFGGGHFGGHFGGGHFGHFGGGHFGHFGGGHFGHFGGGHFGHFGARHFAGRNFAARGAFGHHRMMGNLAGAHGAFNHAGFARNAFGGRNAWNRGWNYGGYGWNGWGYSWGGWYGPVFWPFFYGDLLSFALWPYDFYDPFFGYGPDFLFASIFWPAYGPDIYGWEENPYDVYSYAGGTATQQAPGEASEFLAEADSSCAALAPGITDLPIDRIQKAIDPNDTQKAILADLQAASAKANDILRGSCPSDTPLTPVSRLETVGKRIDAMLQAVQIMRAPLTTLDNSLDDTQRQHFNAIVLGERARRRQAPANTNTLADLCSGQAKNFTNLPTAQIKQALKPSGQQQTAALNALKDASAKAASSIESSCPSTMPQSLTDRFNAIVKRLDAMAGAVKTVEPALKELYSSLDDDQKARFNVMQPPSDVQTPPS